MLNTIVLFIYVDVRARLSISDLRLNSDRRTTVQDPLALRRQFCREQWKQQEGEEGRRDRKTLSKNEQEWGSCVLWDYESIIISSNSLRIGPHTVSLVGIHKAG